MHPNCSSISITIWRLRTISDTKSPVVTINPTDATTSRVKASLDGRLPNTDRASPQTEPPQQPRMAAVFLRVDGGKFHDRYGHTASVKRASIKREKHGRQTKQDPERPVPPQERGSVRGSHFFKSLGSPDCGRTVGCGHNKDSQRHADDAH